MNEFKVTIRTFGNDDTAEIRVDGRPVGWLARVRGERFKSGTSGPRISFVSHYAIVLTDDAATKHLKNRDVGTRAEAMVEVSRAFENWWQQLTGEGSKQIVPIDEIEHAPKDQ